MFYRPYTLVIVNRRQRRFSDSRLIRQSFVVHEDMHVVDTNIILGSLWSPDQMPIGIVATTMDQWLLLATVAFYISPSTQLQIYTPSYHIL